MTGKRSRHGRPGHRPAALLAAALFAAGGLGAGGCGGDSPAGPDPDPDPPGGDGATPASRFGIWEVTGGELRALLDPKLSVRAMRLDEGGTARVYFQDERIGARNAATGIHAGTDTLIIELPAVTAGDPTFPSVRAALDRDVLTLTKPDGSTVTLERRSAVPDGLEPVVLPQLERVGGLPKPEPRADLAPDGNLLVYSSVNAVEAFDPAAGALAQAVSSSTDLIVVSRPRPVTGGAARRFWTIKRNDPQELRHTTVETGVRLVYDVVRVDTLGTFNLPLLQEVRAAAFQERTRQLYLHGPTSGSGFRMVAVDVLANPDEVELNLPFDRTVHAMDADDLGIWVIAESGVPVILFLNPNTLAVRESYAVPDEGVVWTGILSADAGIYLLGTDLATDTGVIVLLEHP